MSADVEIVTSDHGQHGVGQPHRRHRLGHPLRFIVGGRQRLARIDQTESAGPCTTLAEDHQRRRSVCPTLAEIRAARFFAHRHQPELAHRPFDVEHGLTQPQSGAQPLRFSGAKRQTVGDAGVGQSLTEARRETVLVNSHS